MGGEILILISVHKISINVLLNAYVFLASDIGGQINPVRMLLECGSKIAMIPISNAG